MKFISTPARVANDSSSDLRKLSCCCTQRIRYSGILVDWQACYVEVCAGYRVSGEQSDESKGVSVERSSRALALLPSSCVCTSLVGRVGRKQAKSSAPLTGVTVQRHKRIKRAAFRSRILSAHSVFHDIHAHALARSQRLPNFCSANFVSDRALLPRSDKRDIIGDLNYQLACSSCLHILCTALHESSRLHMLSNENVPQAAPSILIPASQIRAILYTFPTAPPSLQLIYARTVRKKQTQSQRKETRNDSHAFARFTQHRT